MAIEHERVVREFFRAWEGQGNPAELAGFMAEDGLFYGNRNWPPHEGRARVQQWWEKMLSGPPHDTRVDMLHVASDGNTVFAERYDTAIWNGRRWYLPILGIGEVGEDGKITSWRDYFSAMGGAPSGPTPGLRPLMAVEDEGTAG